MRRKIRQPRHHRRAFLKATGLAGLTLNAPAVGVCSDGDNAIPTDRIKDDARRVSAWYITVFYSAGFENKHWQAVRDRGGALPVGGPVSSADPLVMERQFGQMQECGIEFLVMDDTNCVWVDNSRIDGLIRTWFDFMDAKPAPELIPVAIAAGGELNQHSHRGDSPANGISATMPPGISELMGGWCGWCRVFRYPNSGDRNGCPPPWSGEFLSSAQTVSRLAGPWPTDRPIGPHPARSVPAVAPHDPPRQAGACRSAIGRPSPGRGLRRREKNATEAGAGRLEKTAPDARAAPPEAHESLISRKNGAEVPLPGLSFTVVEVSGNLTRPATSIAGREHLPVELF